MHIFAKGDGGRRTPGIARSEREAMIWINSRLVIRGFEEAYDVGEERRRAG